MSKLKDAVLKARINSELKESVEEKLDMLGLDSATIIRMLYVYINNYNTIPFDLEIPSKPNKKTIEVIEEIRRGENLTKVDSIEDLRKELEA